MIVLQATSVREFMRAILPTEPHFAGTPTMFRGQADSAWGLVPSLWRRDAWESLGGAAKHGLRIVDEVVEDDNANVLDLERSLLNTLTRVGHRKGVLPLSISGPEVEALARHLGLPSPLLDWTRAPLYAAYFAAADAVRLKLGGRNLVVYAMSTMYRENSLHLKNTSAPYVPGFGNPNLVAQHGLFIRVDGPPTDLVAGLTTTTVEIGKPLVFPEHALDNHFAKILLAHQNAPSLLRVLRDQGIEAGTLFPGQTGAAELVREVFRCPEA
jgi:hypothetical protein